MYVDEYRSKSKRENAERQSRIHSSVSIVETRSAGTATTETVWSRSPGLLCMGVMMSLITNA